MVGELADEALIGKEVVLAGWVGRRRDLGGLIFIDLRDRSGIVQVVFNPETSPAAHSIAEIGQNVISVSGLWLAAPGTETLPSTGRIDVVADFWKCCQNQKNRFYYHRNLDVDDPQLRYSPDLRRPDMQRNIILRHRLTMAVRNYLDSEGFIEVETPMFIKSTPEGARDYVVPSRVNPGKFFALPQSPQIFKQILMVSGFDKYFQLARCFRDEDLRADRQPEFTQIDIEMSFVDGIFLPHRALMAHV